MTTTNNSATWGNVASPLATNYSTGWTPSGASSARKYRGLLNFSKTTNETSCVMNVSSTQLQISGGSVTVSKGWNVTDSATNYTARTKKVTSEYGGATTITASGARTFTWNRTKSDYNIVVTITADYLGSSSNASWTSTMSLNETITIPVRNSHIVSYNANGGTGEIASQTKFYSNSGETDYYETLSDGAGFIRNGYKLVGWNTAIDGSGTAYSLGETYTVNGTTAVTLYAQWTQEIFIKNNGNWTGYVDAEYLKVAGNWVSIDSKYIKANGVWLES